MHLNKMAVSAVLALALVFNPAWLPVAQAQSNVVPSGTVLKLILNDSLSSEDTREGEKFTATVAEDVVVNGRTVIRHGAEVEGTVTRVEDAERLAGLAGRASLMLRYDTVETIYGERPLRATLVSVHDPVKGIDPDDRDSSVWEDIFGGGDNGNSSVDEEGQIEADRDTGGIITRGAIGVAAGALLGALFGNVSRGLLLGSIGGAIAILAPEGKDVELREGTGLQIRLDRDISLET